MSKVITSPVKRFPGTVTLSDPFTLEQAIAWELAQIAANDLTVEVERPGGKKGFDLRKGAVEGQRIQAYIPAFRVVVEAWNLENFSPDPWTATPIGDMYRLTSWLLDEVRRVYFGEDDESEEPTAEQVKNE